MTIRQIILLFTLLGLLLSGCGAAQTLPAPGTPASSPLPPTSSPSSTPSGTPTATPSPSETPAPTATTAPTATGTPTVTPIPTYGKLRGQVIIDQAVCHYGPGAPYLYKYGVYKGSNLEIIARDERSIYIEIQAIGGNNPCWVKAEYIDIKGDLMTVQPIPAEDVRLPMSPYYGPPTGVSARRDGDLVTVFWHQFVLRPGDDSEQVPYLIEAWVCKQGQVIFSPLGSYKTALQIPDEPGCASPSHARLYAVEKHGYTRPVEIPWPPAEDGPPPGQTPTPSS